ncbi:MAG: polymer-forming cytoskeletal protein [Porticoccaceae bacterium]|jgi:cytoskeletal protein CcmA (bactofilin family)|nr:polymer-forming cytoskeletal protein [Porticoccaceae bacterium]
MFGMKDSDSSSPFSLGATTLIAEGTDLEGDLNFKGNLEIQGTVIGNILSDDENARVRILQGGSIQGEVWVANVVINGHVKGDIYASKQAKLAAKAVVEGNIHYNLIEIERGAEVVGSFVHEQPQTNVTAFPKEGLDEERAETTKKVEKQSI